MEITVLGPLAARRLHEPIDLGGPKQRRVLAVLALRPGRVVTISELAHAVWGDTAPKTSEAILHTYVSSLRKVLEPDRAPGQPPVVITTVPGQGYRLVVTSSFIDAWEFEYLTGRALSELAATSPWTLHLQHTADQLSRGLHDLDSALALWGGEPFADLPDLPEAQQARCMLEAAHSEAHLTRLATLAALGQSERALPRLRSHVADRPEDERGRGLLAAVLSWSGRTAEALEELAGLRQNLVAQHGLEPSPMICELQGMLLNGSLPAPGAGVRDDAAPRGVALPARTRPTRSALVGRRTELALLAQEWARAESGETAHAVLAGDPGIGKSRLAAGLAEIAREAGGRVVTASATRVSDAPPWWLFRQVLDALGASPPDWTGPPFAVCEHVVRSIRAAAMNAPLVLVLDDLQWSDVQSLRAMRLLAETCRTDPLLVLYLWRPGCSGPDISAVAETLTTRQALRLTLAPMPVSDIRALAEETVGHPVSEDQAVALMERTDGNPLFVVEYSRVGQLRGGLASLLAEAGTPREVTDLVQHWSGRLPDRTRWLLERLAGGGRDIDPRQVAAALDEDEQTVRELLEVAVSFGFLYPGPAETLRFGHRVLWEALGTAQVEAG